MLAVPGWGEALPPGGAETILETMTSLVSARQALDAGSWQLARTAFRGVAEETADPLAYEGLAQAAWWLDDGEACVGARETAYRRHRELGD